MCKGADSVITERLTIQSKNSEVFKNTQNFVDDFAEEGLRTLFLAERYIDESTYKKWNEENKAAKLEINNREEKVAAVDEKIEIDLELVGSTAIEDKLQDQVADTIQFMKSAGIKVWVLTGDKVETAMNIGVSAGLLDKDMDDHIIEETEYNELQQRLGRMRDEIRVQKKSRKQAIIVAGAALIVIEHSDLLRSTFLEASDCADVVLACRVSPKQKADIVNMIRHRFPTKTTLAIGDGANDVNMILQAHVGVGILGKEG
jgi:phospholipid-transporting ATPase